MLNALFHIEEYAHDIEYEDFINNHLIQDGVIRHLEILGEASTPLCKTGIRRFLESDGRDEDKMIYEYAGVDLNVVWKVATTNIPENKPRIIKMLKESHTLSVKI